MSTESLNRTSDIEIPEKKPRAIRMSPRKVNIDVLKKRVITEKKKEAMQSKIIILFSLFIYRNTRIFCRLIS
jgi:hypothetical protein